MFENQQIITDIAGNQFIIITYNDLEGKEKVEIKPYNPETLKLNNNKVVYLTK
jgi:hypothetical protein